MNDSTQSRVGQWVVRALGAEVLHDRKERATRVLEEALELAQAEDVHPAVAEKLLARVYSRAPGRVSQEAAGVGVTLLAWGEASGLSLSEIVQGELIRIEQPQIMKRIRGKQNEKAHDGVAMRTAL